MNCVAAKGLGLGLGLGLGKATSRLGHLASANSRVVENATLSTKVLDALASNDAALVLRRTGWVLTKRRVVIELVVLYLCQSHLSTSHLAYTC